jgi:hypothetical protein
MYLMSSGYIEMRRYVGTKWLQKTPLFSVEANKKAAPVSFFDRHWFRVQRAD